MLKFYLKYCFYDRFGYLTYNKKIKNGVKKIKWVVKSSKLKKENFVASFENFNYQLKKKKRIKKYIKKGFYETL